MVIKRRGGGVDTLSAFVGSCTIDSTAPGFDFASSDTLQKTTTKGVDRGTFRAKPTLKNTVHRKVIAFTFMLLPVNIPNIL